MHQGGAERRSQAARPRDDDAGAGPSHGKDVVRVVWAWPELAGACPELAVYSEVGVGGMGEHLCTMKPRGDGVRFGGKRTVSLLYWDSLSSYCRVRVRRTILSMSS
jgi:hypothetical protein